MNEPFPTGSTEPYPWFAVIGGKQRGPLSADDLHGMRIEGKLKPETLVWRVGMDQWQPLSQIGEIAAPVGTNAVSVAAEKSQAALQPPPLPSMLPDVIPKQRLDIYATWLKPCWRALRSIPRRWLYVFAISVIASLGFIILRQLNDWDAPVIEGRRLLPERRIKLPEAPGLYAVARRSTLPLHSLGAGSDLPNLDPQVELLLKGDFAADSQHDYWLAQLEYAEAGSPKQVQSVRCFRRPVEGRPDLLRIIPAKLLPPGLYRLNALGWFTVEVAQYEQTLANRAEAALSAGQWPSALTAMRTWLKLQHDTAKLEAQQQVWAEALLTKLTTANAVTTTDFLALIRQVQVWQPALNQNIAAAYRDRAEATLRRGPQGVPEADTLLQASLKLDVTSTNTVVQIAWSNLTTWIATPARLGETSFKVLWRYCQLTTLPAAVATSPPYQLAQALAWLEQGDRARGVLQLETLATTGDPHSSITLVAQQLFAPPLIGRKPSGAQTVTIQNASTGKPGVKLDLLSVEVTSHGLLLGLNAHNVSSEPFGVLYASAPQNTTNGKFLPPLSIIDNNGRKFVSGEGFVGGRQASSDMNAHLHRILLDPNEQVSLLVAFPPVSPGATEFDLISPTLPAQSQWVLPKIKLKEEPFEVALATFPLIHGSFGVVAPAGVATPTLDTTLSTSLAKSVSPPIQPPVSSPTPNAVPTIPVGEKPSVKEENKEPSQTQTPIDESGDIAKMQVLYEQARSGREKCLAMRQKHEPSAYQDSLFQSGEQAFQMAEQGRISHDYAKARVYYKVAAEAYGQALSP